MRSATPAAVRQGARRRRSRGSVRRAVFHSREVSPLDLFGLDGPPVDDPFHRFPATPGPATRNRLSPRIELSMQSTGSRARFRRAARSLVVPRATGRVVDGCRARARVAQGGRKAAIVATAPRPRSRSHLSGRRTPAGAARQTRLGGSRCSVARSACPAPTALCACRTIRSGRGRSAGASWRHCSVLIRLLPSVQRVEAGWPVSRKLISRPSGQHACAEAPLATPASADDATPRGGPARPPAACRRCWRGVELHHLAPGDEARKVPQRCKVAVTLPRQQIGQVGLM